MPRAAAIVLFLGACSDGGGAPDGYEKVFADDFSAGLVRWTDSAGCDVLPDYGRPGPSVFGECEMHATTSATFSGQHAIATMDFALATPGNAVRLFISPRETSSFGDPVIGLTASGSASAIRVEVACAGKGATLAPFARGFHHADLRVEDSGASIAIDGVEVCDGAGVRSLTGDYRIVLALDPHFAGPINVDNVTLYRER